MYICFTIIRINTRFVYVVASSFETRFSGILFIPTPYRVLVLGSIHLAWWLVFISLLISWISGRPRVFSYYWKASVITLINLSVFFVLLVVYFPLSWFGFSKELITFRIRKIAPDIFRVLFGWRVIIEGREHVTNTPTVFVVNHQRYTDGIHGTYLLTKNVYFLIKDSVKYIPIYGQWLMFDNAFMTKRHGTRDGAQKETKRIADYMKEKRVSLLVFPEGHRSEDVKLLPFKKGAFYLALECGFQIIPIVISDTRAFSDHKTKKINSGTVYMRYLPPVHVTNLENTPENAAALCDNVHAIMQRELDILNEQHKIIL